MDVRCCGVTPAPEGGHQPPTLLLPQPHLPLLFLRKREHFRDDGKDVHIVAPRDVRDEHSPYRGFVDRVLLSARPHDLLGVGSKLRAVRNGVGEGR